MEKALLQDAHVFPGGEHSEIHKPEWTRFAESADESIRLLHAKLEYLQLLHTRRLMIRFDDSETQQEHEINCLTEEITALFHKADRSLKKITYAFIGGEPSPSPADRLVRLNTQRAIAGRLQEISIQFRTRQREYLQRLQLQKFGSEIFDVDAMEKGARMTGERFRTGNSATMYAIDRTEYDIKTRDIEIQRIAKSVATLATMFKEVADMVIDQGTLIDRIDYNMDQVLAWLQNSSYLFPQLTCLHCLLFCKVVERMRSGLNQLDRAENTPNGLLLGDPWASGSRSLDPDPLHVAMEPRARRLSNIREPPLGPLAPPQLPAKSFSRGASARSLSGSRSLSTALVLRLLLGLLCVGIVAQWVFWSSSVVEPQRASAVAGPNNGWMNHLRRIEHAAEKDTPEPAPAIDTFEFEPPASDPTHEEEQRRRAPYDPAMHNEDQKQVAEMVQWAWKGYSTYAYGHDSLNVKTYKGTGLPDHDMALTLVDALDTLYLVGMFDEFDRASEWVANNMEQRIFLSGFISFFETTIRLMGGLLSSYYMSGHVHLLTIANKLGMALSPAFEVETEDTVLIEAIALRWNIMHRLNELGRLLRWQKLGRFKWNSSILLASLDIRSTRSRLTAFQTQYVWRLQISSCSYAGVDLNRFILVQLAKQVEEKFTNGLLPVSISQQSGKITTSKITLGANGDSYYEYLLKQVQMQQLFLGACVLSHLTIYVFVAQWLLSGKKDNKFKTQYMTAVEGIMDKLLGKSKPNGLMFIGELVYGKFEPKMDHLVCFVPGMLALGYANGMPEEHLTLAKQLMETCYQMYAQMEAKLAPEIMYFNMKENVEEDLLVSATDAFNLLRPETVESLMVLYRVTKDEKYREYGREIMKAFEKNCRLERGGYASIGNVAKGPIHVGFRNEMESFFIAETLKYLFLLFSNDSMLALDEIVFNTEAHPFPIDKTDS
ncbi:unnamed protein product [Phytophthora lilii]|uniref:alpha-1,2-Mannosidase n=1 Tax=Phytophthora lilii TaxID=2077276 RepID=A0A9W6WVP4_9STRA|nr:unnamed protein product [Phytophthora lilii]